MRKQRHFPASLGDAVQLCVEAASQKRRPPKVLADLMGVELKTLYRWFADTSIPLNRVRQFEEFCGAHFVSDYLSLASGNRVVVDIPTGRNANVLEMAALQANVAEAVALLVRFYESGDAPDATVEALSNSLSSFAFHRCNVLKAAAPELELFRD
ncbi:hypothetical protein [Chitiniphilus eburneus]|uniref:hypothetical protein n=1 Tax=Chitiniphilus eburneus TaxID=2571148 RepID=UPI0035D01606